MINKNDNLENNLVRFVDEMKELVASDLWNSILMDCSKNEVLILWLLYRNQEVNMSQIAEYIHVPLNTATGIIARMEKRNLIERNHSKEDKRVVVISLGMQGKIQLDKMLGELTSYITRISKNLSQEEMQLLFTIMNKIEMIVKEPRSSTKDEESDKTSEKRSRKIQIQ